VCAVFQGSREVTACEYRDGAQYVRDDEEIFNLRHSSARNVVERIFGVLKRRFPIIATVPQYSIGTQALLLPALAALHNWLRQYNNPELEADVEREAEDVFNSDWLGAIHEIGDDATERRLEEWWDNRPNVRQETGPQRLARVNRYKKAMSERMWADSLDQRLDEDVAL
jgi:hypothetical protein